jgi:hypothetical protein
VNEVDVSFINRRKLAATVKEEHEHHLASLQKEVKTRREKLSSRVTAWRAVQRVLMPGAGNAVIQQPPCELEDEVLYLPSDFSPSEREAIGVSLLGTEEAKLREGEAFDALRAVQVAVKSITALRDRKRKNARGQGENTRAGAYIRDAEARRDLHMKTYKTARNAMISLAVVREGDPHSPFPPLTLEDTFMKSCQRGRGLGDSRQTDGKLWHVGGRNTSTKSNTAPQVTEHPIEALGNGYILSFPTSWSSCIFSCRSS